VSFVQVGAETKCQGPPMKVLHNPECWQTGMHNWAPV